MSKAAGRPSQPGYPHAEMELEHAAHRALFGSWGNPATTDPSAQGKDGGVANTNIVWHGGRLFVLEEG